MNKPSKQILILPLLLISILLSAGNEAILVQAKSGAPDLEADTETLCSALEIQLKREKFETTRVKKRSDLRTVMEKKRTGTGELEFFLFGYASVNPQRIRVSFPDGRISMDELKEMLEKIPMKKRIYLFNTNAEPLFRAWEGLQADLVSATDSAQQLNPPRYPFFYLEARRSGTPYPAILKRAGALTEADYRNRKLALCENAMARIGGMVLSYPFDDLSFTGKQEKKKPESTALPAQNDRPATESASVFKRLPPTEKNRRLLLDAKKQAEQWPGYPAIRLWTNITYQLRAEKSGHKIITELYYIIQKSGLKYALPSVPVGLAGLVSATVIHPDASSVEIREGAIPTPPPGSILLLTGTRMIPVPSHLPEFFDSIPLQNALPLAGFTIAYTGDGYKHKLIHAPPHVRTIQKGNATVLSSTGKALPPAENGEGVRFVLTSLDGWETLRQWAERMTGRAMTLDREAREHLQKTIRGATAKHEKVKRIYNALNAMRYVTVPLGGAAFRPQTPAQTFRNASGDCKDKASALTALCREMGIPACRALLNRGKELDPSFASWQFNHMMVYLPKQEGFPDGLWLDPTDGGTMFGDLPPGDNHQNAFLLDAGTVRFEKVRTTVENNLERRIAISPDGASIVTEGTGLFDSLLKHRYADLLPGQKHKEGIRIAEALFPDAEVSEFILPDPAATGKAALSLKLKTAGYFTGFLPPETAEIKAGQPLFDFRKVRIHQSIIRNGHLFPPAQKRWEEKGLYRFTLNTEGPRMELTMDFPEGVRPTRSDLEKIRSATRKTMREMHRLWRNP